MHHPALLLRTADDPLPNGTGDLARDLAATLHHARGVRWVAAADHVSDGQLDPATRRLWSQGGHRCGLVFLHRTQVFLPHPAPGEISPTCALAGDGLSPWIRGLGLALSGTRAHVDIDGERFELVPGPQAITLLVRHADLTEEARIHLDPQQIERHLHGLETLVPCLLDAAPAGPPADAIRHALKTLERA